MAIVSIDGKNLVVTMTGINKVAALKSRIDVPLAHVRGATEDPGIVHESKGLRPPGPRCRASSPLEPFTNMVSGSSGTSPTDRERSSSSLWTKISRAS